MTNVGQELLEVPFPEMIKSLGTGVAEAQYELDHVGLRMMQMMSGNDFTYEDGVDSITGNVVQKTSTGLKVDFGGDQLSLLELGFTPNFYQFVDTIIEVKMSISTSTTTNESRSSMQLTAEAKGSMGFMSASASAKVSMVSASYSNKYQYSAEGSSLMRTKLVPVPPPAILEERIRGQMAAAAAAAAP